MSEKPICPRFIIWRRIFAILDDAWRKADNSDIPRPPNVFNFQGWTKSDLEKKQLLWRETLSWAEKNGFSEIIPELTEDDIFDGDEQS